MLGGRVAVVVPMFAVGIRSREVQASTGRFGLVFVQCDVDNGCSTVQPHHTWTQRDPMRLTVAVSVARELWNSGESRVGRG